MELLIYPVIFYLAKHVVMGREARSVESVRAMPIAGRPRVDDSGTGEGSHV